ncbi:ImmA/IrrE family metallo-endopeptidase [Pseudomonas sp. R5(2019)]|uniref:ImmA/IrrE family metallo-endopeptidase n=1 Tax=Pseudomonas sp. R5(2019) TaxID=2697566 RepID=UPI001411CA56|nr:ImmA/IrrE family metallo-endopeptidase [Pseudomonas sp. R5(2019)]NBA98619.1 ImmA/IrrE family metallo-endopeptidase [Pseudomonas sp. R5(2019)]
MSQAALVNPAILSWSRQRAGLSTEDVARKLPVKPGRVKEWEAGQSQPTFKQAQHWASIAHVPFGFLFLKEPPVEQLPLPDLRTLDGVYPGAARLKYDEYMRALIEAAESAGILVMRSGVALGNTHRKLDVGEFRGFAVSHAIAPVVFINSADADTARLFTLIHELAHIWMGSSGISDGGTPMGRSEEVFCNAVAGEFLVPEAQFHKVWNADIDWQENLPPLASRFHVSTLVIGRRARDLGYITTEQYGAYYQQVLKAFQERVGAGGSYYRTAVAKNSARFSRAVLAQTMSGRMLLRDAGKLLGVQPANLQTYARKLME